ncbi:MAG TPA: NAD(P)-dependent oxidoreductase, partial [Cryptosporangiaceae bacterium]|nr:NAD(P)-dependent oxidoreductase [Cryptosporangiaceae bacterium]
PDLAGADAVIHLAAAVGEGRGGRSGGAAFAAVNVEGAARLLDAAGERPVVWVSSASVYDPRLDRSRVREDHPVGGQLSAYGRTKAAGERLALAAGAVVLRPRAVYGPGDRHLLPRLRRGVRGGTIVLPGPDVPLSLTAVENLADACLAGLDWPPGPYNVADAVPYSRDDVVREVLAAVRVRVRIRHVPTGLATALAWAVERIGSAAEPRLTRYAVDQLAHPIVLDLGRALATGWRPARTVPDFLRAVVR